MSNDRPLLTPLRFLQRHKDGEEDIRSTAALLILNTPIPSIGLLDRLWSNTSYQICADGGANRLLDLFESQSPDSANYRIPTAIHGDLDSLTPSTRAFYSAHGASITRDPDQYSTDFGKSLSHLLSARPGTTDVLILGSISGRVDQGLGLLGELYRESRRPRALRLWLFSEASVSFVLPATKASGGGNGGSANGAAGRGAHRIEVPLASGLVTENAGVLPIFGPARIDLRGFEWDVEDWETEMGGQVSSSNHIRADVVEVGSDAAVLFTVERQGSGGD